ncbi:hypothetical protein IWX90DRAFT_129528 [Phyllosticta citrichinensis]|uniref:Uncharacterized protein n=1 Tax=Phyllosticta citrichinensis TaxID=1130410 RepID=A0ABR1Y4D3_9PEZI
MARHQLGCHSVMVELECWWAVSSSKMEKRRGSRRAPRLAADWDEGGRSYLYSCQFPNGHSDRFDKSQSRNDTIQQMTPSPLLSCTVLLGGGGLDLTASSAICCRLWAAATPKHSLRQLGGDPGRGSLESRLMIEDRGRGLQKIRLSTFDCPKRAVSSKVLRKRLCIETWSLCNIISRLRSETHFDERGVGLSWLPWSHVVRAVLKTLAVFCSAHVSLPRKVSTLHLSMRRPARSGALACHDDMPAR